MSRPNACSFSFQKRFDLCFCLRPIDAVSRQAIHGLESFHRIRCFRAICAVYSETLRTFVRVIMKSRQRRLNLFYGLPRVNGLVILKIPAGRRKDDFLPLDEEPAEPVSFNI